MSFIKIHLVLVIVSISILFAPTTHAAGTTQTRLLNMCKTTTNPSLCYKTILPKALVTPKFNMYRALETEIQAAQVQVLKTATSIATLLWKSASNKAIADSLTVCKRQYSNIVEAVTDTVLLVSKRNVGEARFKFSAVISYCSACKQSFEEDKITSPIAADAQAVRDLVANCLDLMKAIEDKGRKI